MSLDRITRIRLDNALRSLSAGEEVENLLGSRNFAGSVFWVDPENGNDNFTGRSKDEAKATINEAMNLVTADEGDWIVCLEGSHSVTETVTIDKAGVTIAAADMGLSPSAGGEKFTINAASSFTDGPAVTIQHPCRIIGMGIAGRQTAAESLLLDCQETGGFNAGFVHLLNCRFSAWYGAMTYFIRSLGGQYTRIEGCTFDGLFGGVGTSAIRLDSDTGPIDPGFLQIVGNYFYGMGSGQHAISIASSDTAVSILVAHNYLLDGFAGQGKFIDFNSTDSDGLVADNWLAPLANQAAAIENAGSYTGGFADNHYEE